MLLLRQMRCSTAWPQVESTPLPTAVHHWRDASRTPLTDPSLSNVCDTYYVYAVWAVRHALSKYSNTSDHSADTHLQQLSCAQQ